MSLYMLVILSTDRWHGIMVSFYMLVIPPTDRWHNKYFSSQRKMCLYMLVIPITDRWHNVYQLFPLDVLYASYSFCPIDINYSSQWHLSMYMYMLVIPSTDRWHNIYIILPTDRCSCTCWSFLPPTDSLCMLVISLTNRWLKRYQSFPLTTNVPLNASYSSHR